MLDRDAGSEIESEKKSCQRWRRVMERKRKGVTVAVGAMKKAVKKPVAGLAESMTDS